MLQSPEPLLGGIYGSKNFIFGLRLTHFSCSRVLDERRRPVSCSYAGTALKLGASRRRVFSADADARASLALIQRVPTAFQVEHY